MKLKPYKRNDDRLIIDYELLSYQIEHLLRRNRRINSKFRNPYKGDYWG